jgi:hypothetical protein
MRVERSKAMAVAIALAALAAGCRGDEEGRIVERDEDARARQGTYLLADSNVVAELRAPANPGRIIYDAPTDLSYANAQRTRPDLVRGDTARRDTTATRAARDTTGGDAAADTSGGAARRRPARP